MITLMPLVPSVLMQQISFVDLSLQEEVEGATIIARMLAITSPANSCKEVRDAIVAKCRVSRICMGGELLVVKCVPGNLELAAE